MSETPRIYVCLPEQASPGDEGPFHCLHRGLATGIYRKSIPRMWSTIAPFVQSDIAQSLRPRPFYQNCSTWNEAVSFVKTGCATTPNNECQLPRPARKVMSPPIFSQLINGPAVIILEDDDEVVPYYGPEQESPVSFSYRASAIFGTPENVVPFNMALGHISSDPQNFSLSQATSLSAPSSQPGPSSSISAGDNAAMVDARTHSLSQSSTSQSSQLMSPPPGSPAPTIAEDDSFPPPLIGNFHSNHNPRYHILAVGVPHYHHSPERPSGSSLNASQLGLTQPPVSIESEGQRRLLIFAEQRRFTPDYETEIDEYVLERLLQTVRLSLTGVQKLLRIMIERSDNATATNTRM